jgi:hypothetical protein
MTFKNAILKSAASKRLSVLILGAAVVGGVAIVSSGVYASLNATAFNAAPASVTTDTLKLTLASSGVSGLTGGVTTPITSVAPGDIVNRFIDIANTGTMTGTALKLSLADAASTVLTTSAAAGLQITITECPVSFTTVTGSCSTTATPVLAATPASSLTGGAASALTVSSLAPGIVHLKLQISLPTGSETTVNGVLPVGTVQGLTSNLTWTFTEAQRAATTTQG